jgi:serine phosphatase RsbU (regulator of sigma subunit)
VSDPSRWSIEALRAGLLPRDTFALGRLEVATYYRPSVKGTPVGGDWHDVIPMPDGRTALVVGDVMGCGVLAAAVMRQLRAVVRADAGNGMSSTELLGSLDHLVWDLFPDQVVTCLYAVFDPAELTLHLVSAGHPPPLLIHPDGSCTRIPVAAHPPLGVGRPFDEAHRVDLAPGGGVVLYTDGLVERRGANIEAGIETLRQAVAGHDVPLQELPEALVRTCLPDGPDDDVAILAARVCA